MEKTDNRQIDRQSSEHSLTKILPATQELVNAMKGRIRKSDQEEVWAASHMDIDEALDLSFKSSETAVVKFFKGVPVAISGVTRPFLLSNNGIIWMLATEEFENKIVQISAGRKCRVFVREMLKSFTLLYNFVDVRNTVTVKWLEWIGSEFDQPKPYGPDNMLFRKFYIRRSQ